MPWVLQSAVKAGRRTAEVQQKLQGLERAVVVADTGQSERIGQHTALHIQKSAVVDMHAIGNCRSHVVVVSH